MESDEDTDAETDVDDDAQSSGKRKRSAGEDAGVAAAAAPPAATKAAAAAAAAASAAASPGSAPAPVPNSGASTLLAEWGRRSHSNSRDTTDAPMSTDAPNAGGDPIQQALDEAESVSIPFPFCKKQKKSPGAVRM